MKSRLAEEPVGAVRVITDKSGTTARISPMFVHPDFQGRGIGCRALELVVETYPSADRWELDTIREEVSLGRFHERASFRPTGREEIIRLGMTILFYEK